MADNTIKFVSYNLHGMTNGQSMLRNLFQVYDIILMQEYWLQTSELHKIGTTDNDCLFSHIING